MLNRLLLINVSVGILLGFFAFGCESKGECEVWESGSKMCDGDKLLLCDSDLKWTLVYDCGVHNADCNTDIHTHYAVPVGVCVLPQYECETPGVVQCAPDGTYTVECYESGGDYWGVIRDVAYRGSIWEGWNDPHALPSDEPYCTEFATELWSVFALKAEPCEQDGTYCRDDQYYESGYFTCSGGVWSSYTNCYDPGVGCQQNTDTQAECVSH